MNGLDRRVVAAIGAVLVLIIGGVAFAMTRDGDAEPAAASTTTVAPTTTTVPESTTTTVMLVSTTIPSSTTTTTVAETTTTTEAESTTTTSEAETTTTTEAADTTTTVAETTTTTVAETTTTTEAVAEAPVPDPATPAYIVRGTSEPLGLLGAFCAFDGPDDAVIDIWADDGITAGIIDFNPDWNEFFFENTEGAWLGNVDTYTYDGDVLTVAATATDIDADDQAVSFSVYLHLPTCTDDT